MPIDPRPARPGGGTPPGDTDPAGGAWVVWRQDDNGNRFVVARRASRADAEELVRTFEARGHRQSYWAAEDS